METADLARNRKVSMVGGYFSGACMVVLRALHPYAIRQSSLGEQ